MNEVTFPVQSTSTLIKSGIAALVFAFIVYIAVILPVEYNYDPTGAGKLLGLTVLSNESLSSETLSVETGQDAQAQSENVISKEYPENQATIVVPANSGVEYKFKMQKYSEITYEWSTNGQPLYFDFHGEPKGDTTGYFKSYSIATAHKMNGSMTVPFEGVHGWYWKNDSSQDVTITLKTKGNYEIVGLIH